MAKTRMVNTRLWNDSFVSQLDPIEKLLFIYFITNEHTNISGIYELPLKIAALETGIDESMFKKVLNRLKPKIIYKNGWVAVPNFIKHQNIKNQKILAGISYELARAPEELRSLISSDAFKPVDKKTRKRIPRSIRNEVLRVGGNRCALCKAKGGMGGTVGGHGVHDGVTLEIDHIVPVSAGGTNELSNLRVLCSKCNGKRNADLKWKGDGWNTGGTSHLDSDSDLDSDSNTADKSAGDNLNFFIDLFSEVNPAYARLFANKTQRAAISRMLAQHGAEKLEQAIKVLPQTNSTKYAPTVTTPLQLEEKWGALAAFFKKEKTLPPRRPIIA